MDCVMTIDEMNALMDEVFPQTKGEFTIEEMAPMRVRVRMNIQDKHLRPGGTVSGPSMFALADVGMYYAVLAMIGPVPLAVTTNLSIDFMRKPEAGRDLIAEAVIHKLGRALAVGDVLIRSEGSDKVVARAGVTYSIPPRAA